MQQPAYLFRDKCKRLQIAYIVMTLSKKTPQSPGYRNCGVLLTKVGCYFLPLCTISSLMLSLKAVAAIRSSRFRCMR